MTDRWKSGHTTCEILLKRHNRRSLLHRIDENCNYFQNPKRKKLWNNQGQPSTLVAERRVVSEARKTV